MLPDKLLVLLSYSANRDKMFLVISQRSGTPALLHLSIYILPQLQHVSSLNSKGLS